MKINWEKFIIEVEQDIRDEREFNNPEDKISWPCQVGILISVQQAEAIIEFIKKYKKYEKNPTKK